MSNEEMANVEDQGVFNEELTPRTGSRQLDMAQDFSADSLGDYFTTIDTTTEEGEDLLLSMMSDPDNRLADQINKTIAIQHVYCEVVMLESRQNPGVLEPCPRIVILATDGSTYGCTSFGVYQMLRRIIRIKRDRFSGMSFVVGNSKTQHGNTVLTLKPAPTKKK